jgi:hypothetical protein
MSALRLTDIPRPGQRIVAALLEAERAAALKRKAAAEAAARDPEPDKV